MNNEDLLEKLLNKAVSHVAGQCAGGPFPHKFDRCIKEYKEAVLKRMVEDVPSSELELLIKEIVCGY